MNTLLISMQNETSAMTQLVDLLTQEQVALTQAPSLALMEEINAITHKKNQQINTISQLSQFRKNELVRLGFRLDDNKLSAWLKDESQLGCWTKLVTVTKKANELNRVNGILINRHLLRNQSTLQVLQQLHQPEAMPTLYGSNGQTSIPRSVMRGFEAK